MQFHRSMFCGTLFAALIPLFLAKEISSVIQGYFDEKEDMKEKDELNSDTWVTTDDPFLHSPPFAFANGTKEFLFPWNPKERNGDWFYNEGYCRKYGTEMVTIHSATENDFFLKFVRLVGMVHPGVWLGAKIINKANIMKWDNGEPFDYVIKAPGEYNENGVTCLTTGWWGPNRDWWGNYFCTGNAVTTRFFIACQKSLKS